MSRLGIHRVYQYHGITVSSIPLIFGRTRFSVIPRIIRVPRVDRVLVIGRADHVLQLSLHVINADLAIAAAANQVRAANDVEVGVINGVIKLLHAPEFLQLSHAQPSLRRPLPNITIIMIIMIIIRISFSEIFAFELAKLFFMHGTRGNNDETHVCLRIE